MIRLNDIDKTVIDESKVVAYYGYGEDKICIVLSTSLYVDYNSQEQRDKDIELLDKIFDVKSIEDKANAYPHEIDVLNYTVSGIKKECKLVSEGEYDPVKKEEYLTWEEVKNSKKKINIKFSNGDIHSVGYDEGNARIQFFVGYDYEGCIYEEDLFNALKLKRVK
jgi:predicted RNase H-like nuclease (RuvC/YqgF family)